MTRAVLYARVSTQRQAGPDRFSLETQDEKFDAACDAGGYERGERYIDTESGRRDSRKEYQRMLADARDHRFDVIIVTFLDRFGRNPWEIMRRVLELREFGVEVEPTEENIREFIPLVLSAWKSGADSERTAERVKITMTAAAQQGFWQGKPPYGYRVVDRRLVIEEAEADVVRRMYHDFVDLNIGPRRIAIMYNEYGITTRDGNPWGYQTVYGMLQRETYAGVLQWGAVRLEGAVPAIVSPDLWTRAQARWRARGRSPGGQAHTSQYLLTGLLYCECGSRMVGRSMTTKKNKAGIAKKVRGYICRGWQDGAGGRSNWHNADDLEARTIAQLTHLTTVRDRAKPKHSPLSELAAAERELTLIEPRRRRIADGYSREVFTDEQAQAANRDLAEEEQRLRKRIESLQYEIADAEAAALELALRPERITALLGDTASQQEKKAILQQMLPGRIVVKQGVPEPEIG